MKVRYFLFFLAFLILAVLAGCVHTSVRSEIQVFPVKEGNGIPEEIKNKIIAQMPSYYSKKVFEVGPEGQVYFDLWDEKGNPWKEGSVVMAGQTRSAAFLGVLTGLKDSGVNIFALASQGYYGRKNQGPLSLTAIQNN